MEEDGDTRLNWPLVIFMLLLIGAVSMAQECGGGRCTPATSAVAP